jgi:hypothetical protein
MFVRRGATPGSNDVTADQVKQVRDETATRSTGWTEAEL